MEGETKKVKSVQTNENTSETLHMKKIEKADDPVTGAAMWMMRRDDDGNLLNPSLHELESRLILKIQKEQYTNTMGESIESAFKTELLMKLSETISSVAKTFQIDE